MASRPKVLILAAREPDWDRLARELRVAELEPMPRRPSGVEQLRAGLLQSPDLILAALRKPGVDLAEVVEAVAAGGLDIPILAWNGPGRLPRHLAVPPGIAVHSLATIAGAARAALEARAAHRAARVAMADGEADFRAMADRAGACILVIQGHRLAYANPALAEALGCRRDELVGLDLARLAGQEDLATLDPEPGPDGGGMPVRAELRLGRPGGEPRWMDLTVARLPFRDAPAVLAVGVDVTEGRLAQEALARSQERYALATEASEVGVWDWNLDSDRIYLSDRAQHMLDLRHPSVTLEEWTARVHEEDASHFRADIDRHLRGATTRLETEFRVTHAGPDTRWILARGGALRDEHGNPSRMAGSVTDISTRKAAEQQLLHDALHDPLTDLPNRVLLTDRLRHALEARRRRPETQMAVLYLDLDALKPVNDTLGHHAGDELLISVARRLRDSVRPNDTVARLGGDEFAVLLGELHGVTDAIQVAKRIEVALDQPLHLAGRKVSTSASIGIALADDRHDSPEELIQDADSAMYQAKMQGKARYVVFDPAAHHRDSARRSLENDLARAVERQQFCLHYQPIVGIDGRRPLGMEALLRWNHPRDGLCAPGQFIPIAEQRGIMVPIGRWVIREACRQLADWRARLGERAPAFVDVNLSPSQFADEDLPGEVRSALHAHRLPPECLRLQVTEGVIKEHPVRAEALLRRLGEIGVRTCMDDFGTGYSSLSQLPSLSLAALKIDREFVAHALDQERSREVIRGIIALAHALGIETIAEGVEQAAQCHCLRELGCECGQGHLFSPPVAAQRAEAMLAEGIAGEGGAWVH